MKTWGSLIHHAQHKKTILGLPMSSVLQHGFGKCDHPLMTLCLQGSNHSGYNHDILGLSNIESPIHLACWRFPDVCDILHLRILLSLMETALCFTQILHQFIFSFIDGYFHQRLALVLNHYQTSSFSSWLTVKYLAAHTHDMLTCHLSLPKWCTDGNSYTQTTNIAYITTQMHYHL